MSIRIERHHGLTIDEARRRVDAMAERLKADLDGDYRWDQDTLAFERTGASGEICLNGEVIDIRIELSFPLSIMESRIEKVVVERLEQALAD